jgi:hypothetical protein
VPGQSREQLHESGRAVIDEVVKRLNMSRHEAMLSLSGKLARRGVLAKGIVSTLFATLGDNPPPFHSTGEDPRRAELARWA